MSRFPLLCVAVIALAVGCAPADQEAAHDEPQATAVSLDDVAGTWDVTVMAAESDSVLITYVLNATATPDGWTSTLPGREPMPVRVVLVDGDSVVTETGPFESALRPGEMVSTRTVARLHDDMIMGTIVARYDTDGAESVMTGRVHGMRASSDTEGEQSE